MPQFPVAARWSQTRKCRRPRSYVVVNIPATNTFSVTHGSKLIDGRRLAVGESKLSGWRGFRLCKLKESQAGKGFLMKKLCLFSFLMLYPSCAENPGVEGGDVER